MFACLLGGPKKLNNSFFNTDQSMSDSTRSNIQPGTRLLIVKMGHRIQGQIIQDKGLSHDAEPKVKYTDIQRAIGTNHYENHNKQIDIRTIKLWWDRRDTLEDTGSLVHAPRSGRPKHPSFANEEKTEEVVQYCIDLPMGYHQQDVCDEYKCNKKTLRKYTSSQISWVYSPREHLNDNDEVKQKRLNYANFCLTAQGRCKQKIQNATFIDHKMVTFFGLNKRHWMQAKRKSDDYSNLDPMDYLLKNPQLMSYFACNRGGVSVYIHANKRPKIRGSGDTVDFWNVDYEDVIEAFDNEFIDFMNATNSNYVIADGIKMQHRDEVVQHLEKHDIQIHPSACKPHNILNGYPPYSHIFMPLDYRMFAPFQKSICIQCRDMPESYTDSKLCFIYDIIKPTWETDANIDLAENTIRNYANVCHEVIRRRGDIKNMK